VKRPAARSKDASLPANRIIIRELEEYLRHSRIRHVHFGDGSTAPPVLAYVTNFPRLSVPLTGCHTMEVARNGRAETINPVRGHAVFVPDHAWNKPDWSAHVEALTFLFGVKQIGISLVRHKGDTQSPSTALKASVHGGYDVPTHSILTSLRVLAADHSKGPLAQLLTESLLHACLRLLKSPQKHHLRKAIRTYESLCLYVQENFQGPITRESVAQHFGLAPNHISRVFRKEGFMRFNDYLNLVRVNRAKFMLQNYGLTLKEIAFDCGYNDTAYFCRVFKKTCKVTPTEYRTESATGRQLSIASV
jgi:AraC-like DNA-binding protein